MNPSTAQQVPDMVAPAGRAFRALALPQSNAFQRLMRSWAELYPFNTLAVVRVRGGADPHRLQHAAASTLGSLGLLSQRVAPDGSRSIGGNGQEEPSVCVVETPPHGSERESLARHAELELNRQFASERGFPMRLFVMSRGDSHYVGYVCDHWLGDAYTLDGIFFRMLGSYLDLEPPGPLADPLQPGPGLVRLLGSNGGIHRSPRLVGSVVRELLQMRRCYRAADGDRSDWRVSVTYPELPPDTLRRLARAAHFRRVTINDLVLTSLAESVAVNTPDRRSSERRRNLALTSIRAAMIAEDFSRRLTSL